LTARCRWARARIAIDRTACDRLRGLSPSALAYDKPLCVSSDGFTLHATCALGLPMRRSARSAPRPNALEPRWTRRCEAHGPATSVCRVTHPRAALRLLLPTRPRATPRTTCFTSVGLACPAQSSRAARCGAAMASAAAQSAWRRAPLCAGPLARVASTSSLWNKNGWASCAFQGRNGARRGLGAWFDPVHDDHGLVGIKGPRQLEIG
jgi:hypothetical protein